MDEDCLHLGRLIVQRLLFLRAWKTARLWGATLASGGMVNGIPLKLVQIQTRFALITSCGAPENFIAAFGTNIACLFILNPFFGAHLPPVRNGPQNDLFADSHGEIFNIAARKLPALMTSGVTFGFCAGLDLALSAIHKRFVRQAASASNIFYGEVFTVRKLSFAGKFSLEKGHQQLLEFAVIIAVCDVDGADSAIKTAGRNKIRIYLHSFAPFSLDMNFAVTNWDLDTQLLESALRRITVHDSRFTLRSSPFTAFKAPLPDRGPR